MHIHLYILHLPERTDRLETLMKELASQGIGEFTICSGEVDAVAVFRGINLSHKRIVRMAKSYRMPNVIIGEDDLRFTALGAWQYFLKQLELNKDADIFFSMIYEGSVDENGRIIKSPTSFSGMTLYSVNSKFYDVFLQVKEMDNIDRVLGEMADQYDFRVCKEFCAYQTDGFSDNKKKERTYGHYLKGRKLFGVNS